MAFIDGREVRGAGIGRQLVDPATGEVVDEVFDCSTEQVDQAVAVARGAFLRWREQDPGSAVTGAAAFGRPGGGARGRDHSPRG